MFNDPALLRLIALELGIAPSTSAFEDGNEIKNMLLQLSPEDARRCKRKFRKLHRKLRRERQRNMVKTNPEMRGSKARKDDANRFGDSGNKPSQSQRRRRRELVRNFVHMEVRKIGS
mgnify:FL=1